MGNLGKEHGATREAARLVESVRENPAGRIALVEEAYRSGTDQRTEAYSRGEVAFVRWAVDRGALGTPDVGSAAVRGSTWWRSVNEAIVLDCLSASLLHREGVASIGQPSIDRWLRFFDSPSAESWYTAHNATTVVAYLTAREPATFESPGEQVLMNLVLIRALYGFILAAGEAKLGRTGQFGRLISDPASEGMAAVIESDEFYPTDYPLHGETERRLVSSGYTPQAIMGKFGERLISRVDLSSVYAWNSGRIGVPELMQLLRRGSPCYPRVTDAPGSTHTAPADKSRPGIAQAP